MHPQLASKLLIGLLFCALSAAILFGYKWYSLRETVIARSKTPRPECTYELIRFDFHYRKEPSRPSIVMLGNSLIRHAKWDSLLSRNDVINRGISGDKIRCMCQRLPFIDTLKAKMFFIEGGINDLQNGISPDSIVHSYQKIANHLLSLGKIPVINLMIYISEKAGKSYRSLSNAAEINAKVTFINEKLNSYASTIGINVIDMNKYLAETIHSQSYLKNKFTTDGVHLTRDAYALWAAEIGKVINEHGV